jgi:hypothetical protein
MEKTDTAVAVFNDHTAAEAAIKQLAGAGFEMQQLSIIGQGYHTEEKVVGFYNTGERIRFWGTRGAVWGGLWGLFFGGLFITIPAVGPLVVLGYAAAAAIMAIENAAVVGALSVLGAALFSIGIPKNSVLQYEAAVKADGFLVMAHGSAEEVNRAKAILGAMKPARLDTHGAKQSAVPEVIALGAA